jgi:1-acyl-sn-glycerol-3-phosphate acyltransferase
MMRFTIFNTPVIKTILMGIALIILKILNWKKAGCLPEEKKFVIILAPHTSNWDLFYGILLAFAFKADGRFIAKKELFRQPFTWIMKWLGGVPIDRTLSSNVVEQMIRAFNEYNIFMLALAPEGTRHKTNGWKSGFYHIAVGAHVPIQLAFLDYATKTGGAGPLIYPTGDLDCDMQSIRDFYAMVRGRYPDQTSPPVIFSKI